MLTERVMSNVEAFVQFAVQCSAVQVRFCVCVCVGWCSVYASAVGLVVKYLVANEMPRVRFPDGAFSYAALLAGCQAPSRYVVLARWWHDQSG